jgi:hypothetical protein
MSGVKLTDESIEELITVPDNALMYLVDTSGEVPVTVKATKENFLSEVKQEIASASISQRVVIEITGDELANLKNANYEYGILLFPEINGKITEVVSKPIIYRNNESFIESGTFVPNNIYLYHGWGGQQFILNTVFSETSNVWNDNDSENKAFMLEHDEDGRTGAGVTYKGGTGLDPYGDYPAALFAYMSFTGTPVFNPLAKAWICFDVIVRDSPNS